MTKDRRWLYIAILALFVAVFWVGISAVTRLKKSTVPPDIQGIITPLDPNINRAIFKDLEKRNER